MLETPSYRVVPWLQGIFETLLDTNQDCDQILQKMNQHILKNFANMPIYATLLKIQNNEIYYSCAHSTGILISREDGTNQNLFTLGMPLGSTAEVFLEQSKFIPQPPQIGLFFTHSFFKNYLSIRTQPLENSDEVATKQNVHQQFLEAIFQEALNLQQSDQILEYISLKLHEQVETKYAFLFGTIIFPEVPLVCPSCGANYPRNSNHKFCPLDGTRLQ